MTHLLDHGIHLECAKPGAEQVLRKERGEDSVSLTQQGAAPCCRRVELKAAGSSKYTQRVPAPWGGGEVTASVNPPPSRSSCHYCSHFRDEDTEVV